MESRPAPQPEGKIRRTSKELYVLALELQRQHKFDEAAACLLNALAGAPNNPNIHLRLAQILLSQGDFLAGWREFETAYPLGVDTLPKFPIPRWNGMRVDGGRILLVGDQGYGDTIQFVRYIPLVAKRCGGVTLACSAPVEPLLRHLSGVSDIITKWENIPKTCRAFCRLSSLPYIFGTTLDTIPTQIPYVKADPAKTAAWAKRLGAEFDPGKARIGIAWSGRPTHPNDKKRSMNISQWRSLFGLDDVCFVAIQKDVSDADRRALAENHIFHPGDELADFSDTAALVENLDLVISVDTSVAHLAGAMGKPAWVLLPSLPDWRWLHDRSDSPWYPTLRLFRQSTPDDWSEPLANARSELQAFLQGKRRRTA